MKRKFLLCQLTFLSFLLMQTVVAQGAVRGANPEQPTANKLLLLRFPTMSKTKIAFEYGGEIWIVDRDGGRAHRLVTGTDILSKPIFSPDGSMIAYTGIYQHNMDVYVVPAEGGEPTRLTYHPGPDIAVGWTPDGKGVLFRSHRYSYSDPDQLYTVPVTGGFPTELPLSMAETGTYSPSGNRIAYVPSFQWEPYWKGYRGGQTTPIWIAKLSNSSVVKIPRNGANYNDPMWVGNKVYYLSDQDGPITLFAYNVDTHKITKLIDNKGFDITSASAGPGGIIYSQFGQLHIYDFATKKSHVVHVTVSGDLPQLRPHFIKVADQISNYDISPNGVRAVFEAHGDILTVPAKHGSIENLTHSPGVEDRDPAWSPNGKWVAYFSDRDGEYDLYIRSQDGVGNVRKITLGQKGAFYYQLNWSPDSKKLAYSDQKLNLWYVDLNQHDPKPVLVDTDNYSELHRFDESWSPDSRWLTYTKVLPNYLHAVFVYSLKTHEIHQITHGSSDCLFPAFDANGKYLYFTSSTNTALSEGWLDMTSLERPVLRHVYAVLLRKGIPSPLAPNAGFEKVSGKADTSASGHGKSAKVAKAKTKKNSAKDVDIDFNGISSRTIPLPIPAANYRWMSTGSAGTIFLIRGPLVMVPDNGPSGQSLVKFDLKSKKTKTLLEGIMQFALSSNGTHMLYKEGGNWYVSSTSSPGVDSPTQLSVSDMRVFVDPHSQWDEMYHDAWRIERAFFYNPNYDGLNINKAEKEFAAYLPGIASRDGLTFLFEEMLSYMSVGHMFIRGGTEPKMSDIKVGLLGANYSIENGRYRITKIFGPGEWNPGLYAPLAQPGLKVKVGDYLLAVNGNEITGDMNIYQAFQDLANKTVTLTVGPNPDMKGSRQITVKTIPSEFALRHQAWIDHNMALVNKMSDGKIGYVYLPNTAGEGFNNFNRYFFSQVNKKGVIIDERFNHGGYISDYIIDYLLRKPMSMNVTRYGKVAICPPMAIFGPKVMLINQFAGSGGDALPWYFKMDKIGPLVGEKTWGGLVGIGGYPSLMDGGMVTAPRIAVEGLNGTFPVENHGIEPDITVWQNPELVREGHDPQLEAAVNIALKDLKEHPLPKYEVPPYRNYHPHLPPLPTAGASSGN